MLRRQISDSCIEDCLITRALSGLCVGLILTDRGGRVAWLNRAGERVLGMSASQCLGRPLPRLLKDLQLAAFWQEAGETDGNTVGDVTVRWPEKFSLKVNATRYVDDAGKEIGRALLFCDVTAERTLQVALSEDVATRLLDLADGHTQGPLASLTQQEVRVLRMVGNGLGNDRIADELSIARSTVRSHLKQVYRKLGLHSRAEAISFATRNRLV
jgi:DNA-binding CsgD family transcriptional regulator